MTPSPYDCRCGVGRGWLRCDPEPRSDGNPSDVTVKPCPDCRPFTYERWMKGAYRWNDPRG